MGTGTGMGTDPASAAPRPGEVRDRPPRIYRFIRPNGSGNIPRGGERDGGESREKERGEVAKPPKLPCEVNPRGWRRSGAGAGRAPAAPRARSGSARGGSGPAPPRRACGRAALCKRAPAKSCSKKDKPSGKWTHGAARMYFFLSLTTCVLKKVS